MPMCMFIGAHKQSTPGLMGMCLCALVLSRVILALKFIVLYCIACISIIIAMYSIHSCICIFYCLFNYIHTFHHHCHVNTCYHTIFIQYECFVKPFPNEGGCIVTKTPESM